MNAAARVLTGTSKFDRFLTQLMHDNLHWLDVPERVKYKVILARRCLIGTAPRYLAADCVPVSEMAQRRQLRSAGGYQLVVRSYRLKSCGLRAFSLLGQRLRNSLSRLFRDTSHNTTSFGHSLKTFLLSEYYACAYSALGALAIVRYTNLRFTYLITYLPSVFEVHYDDIA